MEHRALVSYCLHDAKRPKDQPEWRNMLHFFFAGIGFSHIHFSHVDYLILIRGRCKDAAIVETLSLSLYEGSVNIICVPTKQAVMDLRMHQICIEKFLAHTSQHLDDYERIVFLNSGTRGPFYPTLEDYVLVGQREIPSWLDRVGCARYASSKISGIEPFTKIVIGASMSNQQTASSRLRKQHAIHLQSFFISASPKPMQLLLNRYRTPITDWVLHGEILGSRELIENKYVLFSTTQETTNINHAAEPQNPGCFEIDLHKALFVKLGGKIYRDGLLHKSMKPKADAVTNVLLNNTKSEQYENIKALVEKWINVDECE
jgi:hypothetical protein